MHIDTREIPLSQGHSAIVDAADFEWLSQWKWCASPNGRGFRAIRGARNTNGQHKTILMHRFIMAAPDNVVIDHINHDTLDNRRANLRLCSRTENQRNKSRHVGSASQYLGVDFQKRDQKWRARIKVNISNIHLGLFATEVEAARAYDIAARQHFGKFANPNFPTGE